LATLAPKLLRGLVLAVIGQRFGFVARQHAHNVDGVADHVSWAPLIFWASWHDAPQK
jgi:hypothetical protein